MTENPIHAWAEATTRADEFASRLARIRDVHSPVGGWCATCETEAPCATAMIAWGVR